MLRELITAPIHVAIGTVGAAARVVRAVLPGEEPAPPPVTPTAVAPPAPRTTASDPTPSHGGDEGVGGRDPSASDWDEEAPVPPGGSDPDDLVITDRVKTQLFGAVDAPTGQVNLNVENGVVFLRGHLDDRDQIEELAVLASAVDGVVRVENLIS